MRLKEVICLHCTRLLPPPTEAKCSFSRRQFYLCKKFIGSKSNKNVAAAKKALERNYFGWREQRERGEKLDVVSKDTEIVGLDHFVGTKTAANKNDEGDPSSKGQEFFTLLYLWTFIRVTPRSSGEAYNFLTCIHGLEPPVWIRVLPFCCAWALVHP